MVTKLSTRRGALAQLAATAGLGLAAFGARAQSWPSKPIRLVVPFAPGGSSEIVARATAQEMAKLLGQSVFVDNKPGAAGNVAMGEVARAEDQHTLILTRTSPSGRSRCWPRCPACTWCAPSCRSAT